MSSAQSRLSVESKSLGRKTSILVLALVSLALTFSPGTSAQAKICGDGQKACKEKQGAKPEVPSNLEDIQELIAELNQMTPEERTQVLDSYDRYLADLMIKLSDIDWGDDDRERLDKYVQLGIASPLIFGASIIGKETTLSVWRKLSAKTKVGRILLRINKVAGRTFNVAGAASVTLFTGTLLVAGGEFVINSFETLILMNHIEKTRELISVLRELTPPDAYQYSESL